MQAKLENIDQFGIVKLIIICYVQYYNSFMANTCHKILLQEILMPALHYQDNISPFDQFLIDPYARLITCTCRAGLVYRMVFK